MIKLIWKVFFPGSPNSSCYISECTVSKGSKQSGAGKSTTTHTEAGVKPSLPSCKAHKPESVCMLLWQSGRPTPGTPASDHSFRFPRHMTKSCLIWAQRSSAPILKRDLTSEPMDWMKHGSPTTPLLFTSSTRGYWQRMLITDTQP